MPAINELLKKAHEALSNFRGTNSSLIGKNGEIVYSKNNVCIHDVHKTAQFLENGDEYIKHIPGYMTLQCQNDEALGVTLILQWLPNTTLEKNPARIQSVSPRNKSNDRGIFEGINVININKQNPSIEDDKCGNDNNHHDLNHDSDSDDVDSYNDGDDDNDNEDDGKTQTVYTADDYGSDDNSVTTSEADEVSDKDERLIAASTSPHNSDDETIDLPNKVLSADASRLNIMQLYCEKCENLRKIRPEQFVMVNNLMLENQRQTNDANGSVLMITGRAIHSQKASPSESLFSVNLGKMRSMRLFFEAGDSTSGQFVIATWDSQYKILHFHHGGLDKLARLLERWNIVKTKIVKDSVLSPIPDRQFLVCQPEVSKTELDPEEGLYERVSWSFWRSYKNQDGSISDSFTVRKAIYFATMDPSLRREVWPFLLRVYPWDSTMEQRETMRNELFIEYQNIKKRTKKALSTGKGSLMSVESTITKDVIRTDRRKPYFAGDNNPNTEIMKNILLNYAAAHPQISYIQGMSDLLAPLLSTIRDESDTYWCFVGLMQQTLFGFRSAGRMNVMDINLQYLRDLLKLFMPSFYDHIVRLGQEALQLMFVHRWILLFYKREFCETDTLSIWEACWAQYRTSYFHLFIAVAIVSIYGEGIVAQNLSNDEILLYFSSLSMHLDGTVVLKKARGLLYQFSRLDKLPCTLVGLYESVTEQWDTNIQHRTYECVRNYVGSETCPFSGHN